MSRLTVLRARAGSKQDASIPHSRPLLGAEEEKVALRVLRSGRLAPGPEAERGAALLASIAGCPKAVLLSSGTLALTLALRALRIAPGDGVAIPSYACAALLHAVRAAGARPVPCDIDPVGLGLDPEDVARRLDTETRLRAAVVVHPFGRPVRLEPFRSLGLAIVEDCAQAIGAMDRGAPVGSRGDAAIFSFAPTKMITCGGPGGGLASPDAVVLERARDLAGHDECEDDQMRHNGLMGDLHAALVTVQLGRLAEFRARRAALARRYDEALAPLGCGRPAPAEGSSEVVYRYVARTQNATSVIERLVGRGIVARRPVFRPLHSLMGRNGSHPHTESAHETLVSIPLYPALSDEQAARIVAEVPLCLS